MYNKPIEDLTLLDDFMFAKVMSEDNVARRFLELLYSRPIRKVKRHITQSSKDYDATSHAVRLDVEFIGDDVVYDIEMQCEKQSDLFRRVRYYGSTIDREYLQRGASYKELPDRKIIFICNFDPFHSQLARYTQTAWVHEEKHPVHDGTEVTYLNVKYSLPGPTATDADISFLNYLRTGEIEFIPTSPTFNSFISDIDSIVRNAKVDSKVRGEYMSFVEKMKEQYDKGLELGLEQGLYQSLRRLIANGIPEQEARKLLGLDCQFGKKLEGLDLK